MSRINNQSRAVIDATIKQIASDNTSGAAEILHHAGTVFTLLNAASAQQDTGSFEQAQQAVIETCIALALAQSDMTPLLRLASAALSAARIATDARDSLKSAEVAALNFIANAQLGAYNASLHAATLIRDGATVLTHSRSSTVLAGLVEAKRAGRDFSVVATESRPMFEGRTLAEAIASQHIPVTVIADAAASLAIDQVDLVVVGADRVTPLHLVNKIGTRMIALAARERGLPIYALCDSSKFISEDYFGAANRHPGRAEELWPNAPQGVVVVNRYFEPTPLTCFTAIVIEDGSLSITEAAGRAKQASIDDVLLRTLGILPEGIK